MDTIHLETGIAMVLTGHSRTAAAILPTLITAMAYHLRRRPRDEDQPGEMTVQILVYPQGHHHLSTMIISPTMAEGQIMAMATVHETLTANDFHCPLAVEQVEPISTPTFQATDLTQAELLERTAHDLMMIDHVDAMTGTETTETEIEIDWTTMIGVEAHAPAVEVEVR